MPVLIMISFFLRFYLFIHERQRERETGGQRHRQREKQASCRESDVGLAILGLQGHTPGPKVALNHWATGAAPLIMISMDKRFLS